MNVMAGAEAWSHAAPDVDGPSRGFLALHGFSGTPSSMRTFAEAVAGAGYHVEVPLLPGHGTTVEDMVPTRWADWTGEVDAAYRRLAARAERIVVAGQSMGGALALRAALEHPEVAGVICVNPATQPQPADVRATLADLLADGTAVVPGIGSDIADPDAVEVAYPDTPVAALLSFFDEGLAPLTDRFGELSMPLLLWTSRQDHVVDPAQSEHLAATYGGPVDHRWLDRSYHVATQDFDRDVIFVESIQWMDGLA
jgi:carboxylesterase